MSDNIRPIVKSDLTDLKRVIETSGLFPSYLLDDMVSDYLTNTSTKDIWITKLIDNKPIAIAYCAPERLTEGTYNLYLIAVHQDWQGAGIGGQLIRYVEESLRVINCRILLVETSGLPDFDLTRKFYDKYGYKREATIHDFYREGEDKVIFWKKLN